MFEDSTFESTGRIRTRSRRWMIATFAINGSVLLALILIPLIYPEALPNKLMNILLTAPPPPTASQPPKAELAHAFRGERQLTDLGLTIPTRIPITINNSQGQETAPGGPTMLTMDQGGLGIPGGDPFRHSAQPVVQPAPRPTAPAHISSGVAAGLLILKVQPQYPPLGKPSALKAQSIFKPLFRSPAPLRISVSSRARPCSNRQPSMP